MGKSLRDDGVSQLISELDLPDGNLEFLGIIKRLREHPQVLDIGTAMNKIAIETGIGKPNFRNYVVHLKGRLEKEGLAELLRDISKNIEFKIIDLNAPSYLVSLQSGAYKIQFY